jgi:glycosyltransferase involved in cell wall biosynthesis
MRVCLSVLGRYHAFDLAAGLYRHGDLDKLITSYPARFTRPWGIPRERIAGLVRFEVLRRGLKAFAALSRRNMTEYLEVARWYDRSAARLIGDGTDIFVGWSGMSLESIRAAKARGAIAIVERGSTHTTYRQRILEEELNRQSLSSNPRTRGAGEMTCTPMAVRELEEYELADFISVPSGFARDSFVSAGVPAEKLLTIAYGVSLDRFTARPKRDKIFRVLFCGAVSLRKGIQYLISAFQDLRLPNAELVILGPIAHEAVPVLAKITWDRIRVLGAVREDAVREIYSDSSVLCLPSLEEGMARVVLQAMACGLPVICTRSTGCGEAVRDGIDGIIVPERDTDRLGGAISALYHDPALRSRMGSSARERASESFSVAAYGERAHQTYRKLLGRSD